MAFAFKGESFPCQCGALAIQRHFVGCALPHNLRTVRAWRVAVGDLSSCAFWAFEDLCLCLCRDEQDRDGEFPSHLLPPFHVRLTLVAALHTVNKIAWTFCPGVVEPAVPDANKTERSPISFAVALWGRRAGI
ncbi:MAG: hypothetical protein IH617_00750 [Hydrogenophaga sp.]|nr:hypothetical protein [Hydrogenophaga sp.]